MKIDQKTPVGKFSRVYLAYLGALAAIVGPAAPLVVAFTRALPTFDAHASILGGLSFLLNITLVGVVMFWRHSLVRNLFRLRNKRYRENPILAILLVGSLLMGGLLLVLYFRTWIRTRENLSNIIPEQDILARATLSQLPWPDLTLFYCGAFLFLQLAFSIMALREYGQAVLGLSEKSLLGIRPGIRDSPEKEIGRADKSA